MGNDPGLGTYSRAASPVAAAQLWFDRGLVWLFAYNHEEAVACFQRALEADPSCAMTWWGIAYAAGPFYNRPWIRHSDKEISEVLPTCHEAISKARSFSSFGGLQKTWNRAIAFCYFGR